MGHSASRLWSDPAWRPVFSPACPMKSEPQQFGLSSGAGATGTTTVEAPEGVSFPLSGLTPSALSRQFAGITTYSGTGASGRCQSYNTDKRRHSDRGRSGRLVAFKGNEANLSSLVEGRCDPPKHREGVSLIVGIFESTDRRGAGPHQLGQLSLSSGTW